MVSWRASCSIILAVAVTGCDPDPKNECDQLTVDDCACDRNATCLACFDEVDLDAAAAEADCDTDTDTDADADSDADSDSDSDTGVVPCLHVGTAPISDQGYQYVTHCHAIGGPDAGTDAGFYSPHWTNPNSLCYAGEHVTPTYVGAVPDEVDLWYANLTEPPPLGLCPMSSGTGDWFYEFLPSAGHECTDYTDEGHGWTEVDAYGLNQIQKGDTILGCGYLETFPVARQGFEISTPVRCVAGSARFDLVPRAVRGPGTSSGRDYIVVPIARTDARFPERAWLRTVSVVSWNDATQLYVSDDGTLLDTNGELIGAADLSAPATSLVRAAGVTMMGARFAIPDLTPGDSLPVVDISWSCEVNASDPHFSYLTGHDSYIADLSDWGIEHPFLFHVDTAHHMLRIAPVGRYVDSIQMAFDSTGHFGGQLPLLGATVEGRIVTSGAQLEVEAGRVTIGDGNDPVEIEVFGELLPPVPAP